MVHWILIIWVCTKVGCSAPSLGATTSAEACIARRDQALASPVPIPGQPPLPHPVAWIEATCDPTDQNGERIVLKP